MTSFRVFRALSRLSWFKAWADLTLPLGLALAAVAFFAPQGAPIVLAGLAAWWLLGWLALGRPPARTPLDLPVLLLLLSGVVGVLVSADRSLSYVAWAKWLAGFAIYLAAAAWVRTRRRLELGVLAVVAVGLFLAAQAPFAHTQWFSSKYFAVPTILRRLAVLPWTISPNLIAGCLVLALPIPLALLCLPRAGERRLTTKDAKNTEGGRPTSALAGQGSCAGEGGLTAAAPRRRGDARGERCTVHRASCEHAQPPEPDERRPSVFICGSLRCRIVLGVAVALMLAILVLSQSRGALAACAIGLAVLACLQWRPARVVVPGLALLAGAALNRLGLDRAAALLLRDGGDFGTLGFRLELWSRAADLLHRSPFTGIGIGTFPGVASRHSAVPGAAVPHAHQMFLQVGVDLGFPGLIAFLALLGLSAAMAWRVHRGSPHADLRALAAGLLAAYAGLVAHGLVDAVTFGEPGLLMWALVAQTVAVHGLHLDTLAGYRLEP